MAKGQTAALCIDNSSDPCIVSVIMHGQDASTTPADGPCATYSNQINVAAGATITCWPRIDPGGFQSIVGWLAIPSGSISSSTTVFNWTDVEFQFTCPIPLITSGCSDAGGTMTDPYYPVNGIGCSYSSATWSSASIGGCRNASWTDGCGTLGCLMDNVTLTFW
jgi:hypothetical protein